MRSLPSGTVTFVFTDIEGSTRLLEELGGERYAAVLDVHHRLVGEAVTAAGGSVVGTEGDAFFAAFPTAKGAVEAAAAAQRSLARQEWSHGRPIRVRIGVHTGDAIVTGDDYVGMDVHRAARIAASAHGGQVVLSQTTRDLLVDADPGELEFRDLGDHRLKDLTEPQRLYQLAGEGLEADFPALKTLGSHSTNLPQQPTPLVGRERELDAVCGLLRGEGIRLVTLTGPGGIGKTRLALQAAAELVEDFDDGVFFVDLAGVPEPELVVAAIGGALGLRERPGEPVAERLREHLGGRSLLLVIDNLEHLLRAAPTVAELLRSARGVKVLATSRAPLRVAGEHAWPVPPLPSGEAVALFMERARGSEPLFQTTAQATIAEICSRLDHLPLAIELAAARLKLLSPEALLKRLDEPLPLLASGSRDAPERHKTLRATIDWSYHLLGEDEQRLLAQLSVFVGGAALEATEQVCDATIDDLAALVDGSLVRRDVDPDGEPRFLLLAVVREYARERLRELDAVDAIGRRHAEHCARLAEECEPLLSGTDQVGALERLEREHGNLRAALAWSVERDAELGLRLGGALWLFWALHGHLTEGRVWFDRVLALPTPDASDRAKALAAAAMLALRQLDLAAARRLYDERLRVTRDTGDTAGVGRSLRGLGEIAWREGDLDHARELLENSLEIARDHDDEAAVNAVLNALGQVALAEGDYDSATRLFAEALELERHAGEIASIGIALVNLGNAYLHAGQVREAAPLFDEALAHARELQDTWLGAGALEGIVVVKAALGGEPARVARLLGARDALLASVGFNLPFWLPGNVVERTLTELEGRLGTHEFEAARAQGLELGLDEAAAFLGVGEVATR